MVNVTIPLQRSAPEGWEKVLISTESELLIKVATK